MENLCQGFFLPSKLGARIFHTYVGFSGAFVTQSKLYRFTPEYSKCIPRPNTLTGVKSLSLSPSPQLQGNWMHTGCGRAHQRKSTRTSCTFMSGPQIDQYAGRAEDMEDSHANVKPKNPSSPTCGLPSLPSPLFSRLPRWLPSTRLCPDSCSEKLSFFCFK